MKLGKRRSAGLACCLLLVLVGLAPIAVWGAVASPAAAAPAPGTITTWAGGTGEGPALNVSVDPGELAAHGPLVYIVDEGHDAVRALDTSTGQLRTVAGNGDPWVSAYRTPRRDGGPATADRISRPVGVAVDGNNRVYVSDQDDHRVRRVDTAGLISTFARIGEASSLAIDASENLFVADLAAFQVQKVTPGGAIVTVAGRYCACTDPPRENVPATEATIQPGAVAVDHTGHLYIADQDRVVRIDDAGVLRRVAGGGGYSVGLGDGGPAGEAWLGRVEGLAFDPEGNLFLADSVGNRVRKVDTTGMISTVAGGGGPADGVGDGGPATSAALVNPSGVVVGSDGALYVSDTGHRRLRRVGAGTITTVAGNGGWSSGGDGGPAARAQFHLPTGIARDPAGNTYVADWESNRVRKIDVSGRVSTIAGTGTYGYSGDGGPATAARLAAPGSVAVDAAGNVLISDTHNDRVRKVATDGTITTVVGGGDAVLGDGGAATDVRLVAPHGLAIDAAGNLYVGDTSNARVRKVTPGGTISTFAGGGDRALVSDDGDGGPATAAVLEVRSAFYLAFDPLGQLHISDASAGRVRKVDLAGVITTVAGGRGVNRILGGERATDEGLSDPAGIAFDPNGSLYVVEGYRQRILRVDLMGRMRIVGGRGGDYLAIGDGGQVADARIDVGPGSGLAFDGSGNLYVADGGTRRIRRVELPTAPSRALATGWNGVGQLGNGSTIDRRTVVAATGLAGVRSVTAGYYHSVAVRADGTVWAWGWNHFGQLGDGTTTDRHVPTRVIGLSKVVAVSAGAFTTLALRADGTVWAWGWNGLGQLGDGTTIDRRAPVQVPGLSRIREVAGGGYHSLAVGYDGRVWAWGWNGFGQLGTASMSNVETRPAEVPGAAGAVSVAAGAAHSSAVRLVPAYPSGTYSEVWSWGWNRLGQLGDGTTVDRRIPVKTFPAERVSTGAYHNFTVPPISAWGYNGYRQLGTKSDAPIVPAPALVALPRSGDRAAGGLSHSVLLATDGSVWAWGWNGYGALGDGTVTSRALPSPVSGVVRAGAVAAGAYHSVVVQ